MIGDMISVRGYGRFRLAQRDGFQSPGKLKSLLKSVKTEKKVVI